MSGNDARHATRIWIRVASPFTGHQTGNFATTLVNAKTIVRRSMCEHEAIRGGRSDLSRVEEKVKRSRGFRNRSSRAVLDSSVQRTHGTVAIFEKRVHPTDVLVERRTIARSNVHTNAAPPPRTLVRPAQSKLRLPRFGSISVISRRVLRTSARSMRRDRDEDASFVRNDDLPPARS